MRKILILANSADGLYLFRRELIFAMMDRGWEITIACPRDKRFDQIATWDVTLLDTPMDRHGMNPIAEWKLLREYKRIIGSVNPDVILTYTIKPNIYGNLAARHAKIPVISTITGLGNLFIGSGMSAMLAKSLYRFALRKTACVIFQNQEDRDSFRATGMIKKQEVLLVPGSGVNLEAHKMLDYPVGDYVSFLFIGRAMKEKGVIELIEASRRLKLEFPGAFAVVMIGDQDGPVKEQIENAVKNGVVRFDGYRENVPDYVKEASCVVLPSYREGMSNALLEAAAMGRPLIASDVCGCREIVEEGGNGFLCKPRDVDSLYECMKRFLELTRERRAGMGVASRGKVEREFDRDIVVETVMELVEKVVE